MGKAKKAATAAAPKPAAKAKTAADKSAPSVGRIVHYHEEETAKPIAALVTDVSKDAPGYVDLTVFRPRGGYQGDPVLAAIPFSETPKAGCWSWPPRA